MRFFPISRPSPKSDDPYIKKLITFIPAEIIGAYIAITGFFKVEATSLPEAIMASAPDCSNIPSPDGNTIVLVAFIFLAILTPFWTYLYSDAIDPCRDEKRRFHAIVAFVAFIIWAISLYDIFFAYYIEHVLCVLDWKVSYDPRAASVIIVVYTLLVPFLYDWIFPLTRKCEQN